VKLRDFSAGLYKLYNYNLRKPWKLGQMLGKIKKIRVISLQSSTKFGKTFTTMTKMAAKNNCKENS
jgi:hypothetical protein